MTILRKIENNVTKNRDNSVFGGWIAIMSKLVRYGGRVKRGRRDWAGGAPPCRSPVADRIRTSRAHGEKFSILAQGVKGRNEGRETKHGGGTTEFFSLPSTNLWRGGLGRGGSHSVHGKEFPKLVLHPKHVAPPFAPFNAVLKSGPKSHAFAGRIQGKRTKTWVNTGTIVRKKCQK